MKLNYLTAIALLCMFFYACDKDPIEIEKYIPEDSDGIGIVLKEARTSNNGVVLSWLDNTEKAEGYKIYRKNEGGSFAKIVTLDTIIYTYTDTSVQDSTSYYYYAEVFGNGFSIKSNEVKSDTIIISSVPEPEYYLSGSDYFSGYFNSNNQSDVFYWNSYGTDLDIEIYNSSSQMDIACRVWDENGQLIGDYNSYGAGNAEYIYDLGYGNYYIIEVYTANSYGGDYEINVY
ncbi:MAG: hypothetical protein JEZ09_11875 [Salinivirgaceae bacterium]|nr:hypothetical protein [Salinivirgaceae bacterium]